MAGPTYVLDKTFRAQGTIGTFVCVRVGPGTVNRSYVSRLAGTNTPGSILPIGISQTGASKSGKDVVIRMLGISKAKMQVTSGSLVQGNLAYPSSLGQVKLSSRPTGTVPKAFIGQFVGNEGSGSPSSLASVFVLPIYQ